MDNHKDLFRWVEPDGGIICFPKYSMNIPSVNLCKHLFETQKILVNPGTYFNADGFVRLSYGGNEQLLQEALEHLAKGLQEL